MSNVMWSVAEIAARDGVSKAAVSKAVKKLVEARPDTPIRRGGQGQVLAVSLAHYDEYRSRYVNPAKAGAPIRRMVESVPDLTQPDPARMRDEESYDEARRQSEWLKVGREKIRHQEECGQLIRKDQTEAAVETIATEMQAIIRRLPNRADDLALAVSKEGVHGARVFLRKIAFEMGNAMADKLEQIAATAPMTDDLIEGEDA